MILQKTTALDLILLEIATDDIISSKSHPHKFLHSIAVKYLMLMIAEEINQKTEAEIGPYFGRVYGNNRYPNLHSVFCTLSG